jgi:hypothetical protein
MLSDAKFHTMKNFITNWSSVIGGAMMDAMGEALSDAGAVLGEAMDALAKGMGADDPGVAAEIREKIPSELKELARELREQGPDPAELEKARQKLDDSHVTELEQLFARHDIGLPPLTQEFDDTNLLLWLAATQETTDAREAFMGELQEWLGKIFAILDEGEGEPA